MTAAPTAAPGRRLPLFFQNLEALDSNRHRGLRRVSRKHYRFALGTNAVPLGYNEIPRASQEYPVVVSHDGEAPRIVALVGLTADRNLFVDGDSGAWLGRYVPAYLRVYPFVFARAPNQAAGTYTVAIDPTSPELVAAGGVALFEDDGQPTSRLRHTIEFLQLCDAQMEKARQFAARLEAFGLLSAVGAKVQLNRGGEHRLAGFSVVERERLQKLGTEARMELYDSEYLEMIYHHLASLRSFSSLVDKLALVEAREASRRGA